MGLSELRSAPGQRVREEAEPVLEAAGCDRSIEDEEPHFAPKLGLVLTPNDTDGTLKSLATDPQLTIQRLFRQGVDEPGRSMIKIALAGEKLPAIPVGPNTVKLLAHPPVGQIGGIVPTLGQKQRRPRIFARITLFAVGGGFDGPLRNPTADAGFLPGAPHPSLNQAANPSQSDGRFACRA